MGLLRQIVLPGIDWDVPLPPDLEKTARAVLQEIVKTQDVVFHRSMVPAGAQGKPELVCFWDGGKPASAGCIYLKWSSQGARPRHQTDGGRDLWPETLPRKEPISSKASLVEKNCIVIIFEEGAYIVEGISDRNRVPEVQDHMADWEKQGIVVEPLHHWPGTDNIADIATKGEATVRDIESGSAWQHGPDALRLGREQWPASRDFIWTFPEEERSPIYASHVTGVIPLPSISELVTTVSKLLSYSDELRKVVSILACVMAAHII